MLRVEVAVTGLGAVSGYGEGAGALWRGIAEGRDAFGPIERFPCGPLASPLGGVLPPWPGELPGDDELRWRDLCVRVAVSAAREALASAGLGEVLATAPERVALVVGTSVQQDQLGLNDQVAWMARALGVRGPCAGVGTACSASTGAVGLGRDLLEAGSADVVLAGGADTMTPELVAGFHALGLLSRGRCAPFSEELGTTLGEGAGFVVLESAERAIARSVEPIAWLRGYGLSGDAHHETSPDPSGAGVARAIRAALGDAGLAPEQVGYVNAHGTGTGANDAAEWRGLQGALGARAEQIPVSSTKGHLGHAQGAAGILELIATLMGRREGKVPPTLHFTRPRRGAPADPVGESLPRACAWEAAVCTNSAMAGSNAAVVVSRSAPARAVRTPLLVTVAGMGVVVGARAADTRATDTRATDMRAVDSRAAATRDGRASATDPDALSTLLAKAAPTADPRGMDPSAQLLTAAAALALRDGALKITTDRRDRAGLLLGNGHLSPATVRAFRASIAERGLWRLATSSFARRMPSAPAGACAAALDLRGPGTTIATGEGESLCAVAFAAQLLSSRATGDLLLAGGVRESESAAEVLALVAGGDGPVTLAGWGLAGPGQHAAALQQAVARAGLHPSGLRPHFPTFIAAVEAVRSGQATAAAAVTAGGCASCALVFCRTTEEP